MPADCELPGMWEQADLIGGETDCDLPARTAEAGADEPCQSCVEGHACDEHGARTEEAS
jgi:hypothetical protein